MAHIDQDTARAAVRVLEKFGRTITYRRGVHTVELTAARSRTPSQDLEEERFQTTSDRFRWLLKASELVLDGNVILPAEGDKIEEAVTGKTFHFEVLHDGQTRAWDYFDTGREYLWVRTKEHKTVVNP